MRRSRIVLLLTSSAVVVFVLGSGVALKAGPGDGTFRQMLLFSEVLSYAVDNYVDPVDTDKLMRGAHDGLMSGLDAHGAYLSPEDVDAWKRGAGTQDAADPGFSVLKSGPVIQVVSVAAGSPAEGASIAVGDQIRKIDGRSVRSLSLDQSQRMLKGAAGTSISIDLFRVRDLKREVITVARAARRDPPYVLDVTASVAVLKIRDLDRLPTEALVAELGSVKDRGADRLLIDLRDAASTTTRRVAGIADLFATGDFLRLADHNGHSVETIAGTRTKPVWAGPVAVLVNGATAGAGEGLAMILRDRRKAAVYGEPTYGLGTEARLIELPEGGGLLVPGYVWETVSGKRWNADGLAPDKVEKSDGRRGEGDDDQLKRTLEDFGKIEAAETAPKAA
jgi:carboxyl-terminal processing protease